MAKLGLAASAARSSPTVGRRNLHTLGRGSILPPNLAFAAFASPCDCTKIVLTPN